MSTLLVVSNILSKFAYKTHFSFLFTLFLAWKENTEIRGRIIEILEAFLRGIMSQTINPALPIMAACDGDWQTTCYLWIRNLINFIMVWISLLFCSLNQLIRYSKTPVSGTNRSMTGHLTVTYKSYFNWSIIE